MLGYIALLILGGLVGGAIGGRLKRHIAKRKHNRTT
jgi:hypothetical protein